VRITSSAYPITGMKSGTRSIGEAGYATSAQDRELVAQHDDLEVLRPTRADCETGERADETVENTRHGGPGGTVALFDRGARSSGRTPSPG
jgi:hypothetical protein